MENNTELIAQCEARAKEWLSPAFDEETRKAVQAMLDNADKTDLIDAFYQNLEFGTGGLRGIMGAGTNRMNKYIVGMATQGFANYILKAFPNRNDLAVVVGHDHHVRLRARRMSSPDIRAGIALLIAALSAEGTSRIDNVEQIDRGYENIDLRLNALGANIRREDE